ncbi:heterokaryon incompatibility protein-domain-containing protein [Boeremia exigua]|uniref:heterokaryon incompatibility protein-domain-containing protein n=1 Tax=Boeremia exigua TaxID=749465 RepID=UPI001E8E7AAE|nr:heterokaryon incompatibility protein-domain-containing protein [Boeremia exigua]KAH6612000.1 heterokaryon incompatibility protein-domain-containing protein [Boeremia exigua]
MELIHRSHESSFYRHTPLNAARRQIRLIKLLPTQYLDDEVACKIEEFDLELAPAYVTLSYTWGPPSPSRAIVVNGKLLLVRQNLYDFLKCHRNDHCNFQYLWIDQICICQAHHGERSHQVQLMSRIYTGCLHVIVWLGMDKSLSPKLEDTHPLVQAAKIVFSNNYWRRLWIIQELLLPKSIRVRSGVTWLPFNKLVIAAKRFGSRVSMSKAHHSIFSHFRLLVTHSEHEAPARGYSMSLAVCLRYFVRQECYDPRDKVYGLLSLSTHEVYMDALRRVTKSSDTSAFDQLALELWRAMNLTPYQPSSFSQVQCNWSLMFKLMELMELIKDFMQDISIFASAKALRPKQVDQC